MVGRKTTPQLEKATAALRAYGLELSGIKPRIEALATGTDSVTDALEVQERKARQLAELNRAELDKKLAALENERQLLLSAERLTAEERIRIIQEDQEKRSALIEDYRKRGLIADEDAKKMQIQLAKDGARAVTQEIIAGKKIEADARKKLAASILAVEQATAAAIVAFAEDAAEKGKWNAREFAGVVVKTAGQAAAAQILAWSAAKAAEVGLLTPAGAAYLVAGAALATSVAALTGVAVRAIKGPSGQEPEPPKFDTPDTPDVDGGVGGRGGDVTVSEGLGRSGAGGPVNNYYFQSLDGRLAPETLEQLQATFARRDVS